MYCGISSMPDRLSLPEYTYRSAAVSGTPSGKREVDISTQVHPVLVTKIKCAAMEPKGTLTSIYVLSQ